MDERLNAARAEIDAIDRELVSLIVRRMDVVAGIGEYKREQGLPVFDGTREQQLLEKIRSLAGEKYATAAEEVYAAMLGASRFSQRSLIDGDDSSERLKRTAALLGENALDKLKHSNVAVFGMGGVGSAAAEALVRSGLGSITLIDGDCVEISNINRQLIATELSVGIPKVRAAAERYRNLNPDCRITQLQLFYLPENADRIDLSAFDLVIDAIDTVSAKLELALRCEKLGVPLIAALGTGNKLDASRFRITDISKTAVCPLARVMRRELRKRGVEHYRVLWSDEEPIHTEKAGERASGHPAPASIATVPPCAGLMLAGDAIRTLTESV